MRHFNRNRSLGEWVEIRDWLLVRLPSVSLESVGRLGRHPAGTERSIADLEQG